MLAGERSYRQRPEAPFSWSSDGVEPGCSVPAHCTELAARGARIWCSKDEVFRPWTSAPSVFDGRVGQVDVPGFPTVKS